MQSRVYVDYAEQEGVGGEIRVTGSGLMHAEA